MRVAGRVLRCGLGSRSGEQHAAPGAVDSPVGGLGNSGRVTALRHAGCCDRVDTVVLGVSATNLAVRHRVGKSDPTDALAAARAAVSGVASGRAKSGDGPVEAMRVTLVAKRSTRAHRIEVITQLRHLVVCGPDRLRERLEDLSTVMVINTAAAMRP